MREDPIERVDRVIERLDGALRKAGFDPLAPASEPESVGEVERALAPYTLPPDLRRFWERVDFSGLCVTGRTLPERRDPRPALEAHRQNVEEAPLLFGPPLLFPIARISGDQWSIELVSRWAPGGTVFSQDTGADELQIEYASFSDLLEVYVELIEEGCFQRRDDGLGSLNRDAELGKQEARLAAAPLHPLYGDSREIAADPARWPEHWLEAAGLDLRDRKPLGATHTIAELIAESYRRPLTGRIRGEVVRSAARATASSPSSATATMRCSSSAPRPRRRGDRSTAAGTSSRYRSRRGRPAGCRHLRQTSSRRRCDGRSTGRLVREKPYVAGRHA